MSEDAPVNTGAVAWPDDFTASVMEHYSKPHVIEKKKSPLAASNASR